MSDGTGNERGDGGRGSAVAHGRSLRCCEVPEGAGSDVGRQGEAVLGRVGRQSGVLAVGESQGDDEAAVWQFAREYARTAGDGPSCTCTPCRAYRAVRDERGEL